MKERICTSCYHVGKPIKQGPGSFFVDAMIWMVFISLSILSAIFVLMIIPVVWTLYHLWVYDKTTCPKCERIAMVSLTSRKGREALNGPKWVVSYKAPEAETEGEKAHGDDRSKTA